MLFLFLFFFFFWNRPAVTELHNAEQVERVRKENSVCFFLVTSSENLPLSEKLKVNLINKTIYSLKREYTKYLNIYSQFPYNTLVSSSKMKL